ncbi:MAG: TIGR02147 family protein [Bacteriovoracaceae bacterium]
MLSVYNYKEPMAYIQDFIHLKKREDDSFSIRKWSEELGFSSPAVLVEILKGKKALRPAIVKNIIDKIGLDKSEYMYFMSMVAKSKSTTDLEEMLYDLFMNELTPSNKESISIRRFTDGDFFSHWIFTTILSLAELKDFKMTAENIQSSLREHLPIELVHSALDYIKEKGLLNIDDEGTATLVYDLISTENDKKYNFVENYYAQMADLSKKAIKMPLEQREFQSFSIVLNKDQIPMAKEIIRQCRNKLTKLHSPGGENVYQMNLSLFPLTQSN